MSLKRNDTGLKCPNEIAPVRQKKVMEKLARCQFCSRLCCCVKHRIKHEDEHLISEKENGPIYCKSKSSGEFSEWVFATEASIKTCKNRLSFPLFCVYCKVAIRDEASLHQLMNGAPSCTSKDNHWIVSFKKYLKESRISKILPDSKEKCTKNNLSVDISHSNILPKAYKKAINSTHNYQFPLQRKLIEMESCSYAQLHSKQTPKDLNQKERLHPICTSTPQDESIGQNDTFNTDVMTPPAENASDSVQQGIISSTKTESKSKGDVARKVTFSCDVENTANTDSFGNSSDDKQSKKSEGEGGQKDDTTVENDKLMDSMQDANEDVMEISVEPKEIITIVLDEKEKVHSSEKTNAEDSEKKSSAEEEKNDSEQIGGIITCIKKEPEDNDTTLEDYGLLINEAGSSFQNPSTKKITEESQSNDDLKYQNNEKEGNTDEPENKIVQDEMNEEETTNATEAETPENETSNKEENIEESKENTEDIFSGQRALESDSSQMTFYSEDDSEQESSETGSKDINTESNESLLEVVGSKSAKNTSNASLLTDDLGREHLKFQERSNSLKSASDESLSSDEQKKTKAELNEDASSTSSDNSSRYWFPSLTTVLSTPWNAAKKVIRTLRRKRNNVESSENEMIAKKIKLSEVQPVDENAWPLPAQWNVPQKPAQNFTYNVKGRRPLPRMGSFQMN